MRTAISIVLIPLVLGGFSFLSYTEGVKVGYTEGRKIPRVCAQIKGLTPISSTNMDCLYIRSIGLATWRRVARLKTTEEIERELLK